MKVDEAVGRALAASGVRRVFGVLGSGNFIATDALIDAGAQFVATRHENGAVLMADSYSRLTGEVSVASVHQGPGFTNALTALVEAFKSRSPIVLVSAATPDSQPYSNFYVDQKAVIEALGITVFHVAQPADAVRFAQDAVRLARDEHRAVVLNLSNDVQREDTPGDARASIAAIRMEPATTVGLARPEHTDLVADAIAAASRPIFLVGRGASTLGPRIAELANRAGALLATTAPCRGLFAGHPWSIDVSGGFASPGTLDLIRGADLIVAFGASLNRWTTLDGTLLTGRTVIQIDRDRGAFGRHFPVDHGVEEDAEAVVAALEAKLESGGTRYRTHEVADKIANEVPWSRHPYDDTSTSQRIDPRKLSIALNDQLPRDRTVAVDGGNFNGYPAMYLDVPDRLGTLLPISFASIGLSIPSAMGAAIAQPGRTAIAGLGDGGFLMSHVELETAVRLQLDVAVLVYNDAAYGAEVHHFGPQGYNVDPVSFPEVDIAAIARGYGCAAFTVRSETDCEQIGAWYRDGGTGPIVIDAKITSFPSWVLEHTFTAE